MYRSSMVLGSLFLVALPAVGHSATGLTERFAEELRVPIGIEAPKHFQVLVEQPFEENVGVNNNYIRAQLGAFMQGSPEYQRQLGELIYGSHVEQGLGWSNYLTEPSNVGVGGWDEKVQAAVGEEGYARLVAFVQAFPVGSDEFMHTFGGERRFDPATGEIRLNLTPVRVEVEREPQNFGEQVVFSDEIRKRMFEFYSAFEAGEISEEQVMLFNEALVTAGGCALAATDNPADTPAFQRYNVALNLMERTLTELGY